MTLTVPQAREQLDAQVREVMACHFDPEKGTPFWLEKAKELGFDPRQEVKTYADGIGPWKRYIVSSVEANLSGPGEASRKLLPASNLIERAHKIGLLVHTWTFRNEQRRLVSDYAGNPVNEYLQFYRLGIDGLFSDFADTAVAARILFELERDPDAGRCLTGDRDGPKRQQPECPEQRD